jgi:Zn-dependent protease with chaperone function
VGPLPESQKLENISARAFEHPADRAATAALRAVPMLDTVVRKLVELQYERALRQSLLAGSVKIGPDQLPSVWAEYRRGLTVLDMPEVYDLYVADDPFSNAYTIGAETPMILLNSRLEALLESDEVRTVLAHEIGHVLSDHVLYRTALMILLRIGDAVRVPVLSGLPLMAVRAALMEWFRAAELSCDRAATLVNRDPLVTCRTLMVIAGGVPSERLNLDAFLKQANEYKHWESKSDRVRRFFTELTLTHSYSVRRVSEVMDWVRSGEYDAILAGEYTRRGEEPAARAEAGDAVDFYTERFRTIFKDASEQVASAGDQMASAGSRLADWLRKDQPATGEPDESGDADSR